MAGYLSFIALNLCLILFRRFFKKIIRGFFIFIYFRWAINQREAAARPAGIQGLGLYQLHLQEVRGADPAGRSFGQGRGEAKLIQPVFI